MTLYGYARVSVREPEDKNLDLQVERLVRAGCSLGNIRAEEASGARNDRGGLLELLDLVVTHIDRLSRGLTHGLQVIEGLHRAGVEFRSLSEDFDTATATGKRGYHPLLAIAAGTGDVLMSRLRQGRANTARGAAHFLRETVGRVRYGGASGQLTVRADSGFYTHALVAVCREMGVRFSITIRQHKGLRELIEAIPEQDWTPIPYWMDGAADVAQTTTPPSRVKPTPRRCGSSSGG